MDKVIKLENVNQYNELYGLETLHPLISVIDLTKSNENSQPYPDELWSLCSFPKREQEAVTLNMVVSIMTTKKEPLSVLPPGQTAGVSTIEDEINPAVYGIVFHPDLIRGTSLGKDIKKYTFFSYAVNEALHLSDQEKK